MKIPVAGLGSPAVATIVLIIQILFGSVRCAEARDKSRDDA
jgi:hypothetical protein